MIFQNPLGALDPRMTAGEIIAEALTTHERRLPRHEVRARVAAMLERVGLLPEHINRYPHEFSGGQCQRINVARALIVEPKLVTATSRSRRWMSACRPRSSTCCRTSSATSRSP